MELNHREKVEQFNKKLAKLPEHFDIPKVGPGWELKIIHLIKLTLTF